MARTSSQKILSTPVKMKELTFMDKLSYVLLFILDVTVIFSVRIPMNFFRWLVMIAFRAYAMYTYAYYYHEAVMNYITPSPGFSFGEVLHNLFSIGVCIFILWYFITTLMMFLAVLYKNNSGVDYQESSQFSKTFGYIENKLSFMGYEEGLDWLRGKK